MLPNTLFMGHQLYKLEVCESTNTEAHKLLIKNEATEGCTIITDRQTNGRGQRGNFWEAAPGKNITLSVILSPSFLFVRHQFYLNIAVSLGVLDLLHELGLAQAKVKWPNDLYFEDSKLGGILIENTINSQIIQHSIVGIGLNINQLVFGNPTATSVSKILNKALNVEEVAVRMLELLEKRYLGLRAGKLGQLKFDYLQALYRYQEPACFEVGGKRVAGTIVGVEESGRLAVEIEQQLQYFDFKEIAYLI
ncbi:biotin--[acetyl-CoA-carboxylase] ligase [Pontibacter sp. SGAir0037]|uniref:biotin--[acetyl-CoA-carboxylase] ligase n=1 Tax=Pontibacter sp. SGAir0037 TaxID=2571030 RepID=UPI0010CD3D1F|nr:biotin--[acetyl-CoA-carboxylase] ligase [Pontibacter sp. SGAir0037]QCR24467.1 biotin--[acetyl-CoA-carboxylase] ligase [Pontibacter sp. SGAir0037]